MRFDLTDLSLFRHVVEAGSITHGAERCASRPRRRLDPHPQHGGSAGRHAAGARRQGVTPTQAGRTLLAHARTILRQSERLREDLGAYAGGLAGQIRVLSNTNALTEFLPEALSSFLAAHPNVSVDLEEKLSDEIVGQIAEGVADLGIVAATVDVSELETYPFRKDRFVLAVAHDHPLAKRSKIAFADVLAMTSSASTARAPCSGSSPTKRRAAGSRCGCACNCAASTRSAVWSNAMSASASCRRPRRGGWHERWQSRRWRLPTPGRHGN